MKESNFKVKDRKISPVNIEKLIGYVNQDKISVDFDDDEWQTLSKTMKLVRPDGQIIHIVADMNEEFPLTKECYVEGNAKIGFFGTKNEDDPEDMAIASTDYINLYFSPRAYQEGEAGIPMNLPTPTEWDIIVDQMSDIKDDIASMAYDFDGNYTEKLNSFNANATDKTREFDSHVTESFNELTGDFYTKGQMATVATSGNYNDLSNKPIIPSKVSDLTNDIGYITKNVNNLENYDKKENVAHSIEMSMDEDYVITVSLKNSAGTVLNTQTVDLPLETVVVSGEFDSQTKEIKLTLENGSVVKFSVADLVSGLQTEITVNNKLSSDLVSDSNKTNKFVTTSEKTTWNGKYDKPGTGIPKSDLDSSVQASLGKADTAIQDISGKVDKTSFSYDSQTETLSININ